MILAFDEFELDPDTPELRRAGVPLKAEALVLRLLSCLVRSAGQLVSKQQLIAEVWNGRVVADNAITVSMVRLRKLLGHKVGEREIVVNVHGRGYRFVRPVAERDGTLLPVHGVAPPVAAAAAPFVGRDGVLRALRAALQDAGAGRGSVCVISGEPGIGKTRVVEELERDPACAGFTVAWGYCREAGETPPLWPFARLLRELESRVPLRALAARLGPAARELERVLPGFWEPPEPRSASEQGPEDKHGIAFGVAGGSHRVFDAVARCFALAAEHTPLVLVLDDLHRADPGSLALLRAWVDEIARARVLVLCTLRSTERAREEPAASCLAYLLGHRNCTRVDLGRLSAAEVASYVTALRADAGRELEAAVFARSEGNPFFMTELARSLRDDQPIEPIDYERLRLPSSALEIVRQRVRKLDDGARGVLSCAAVIGRSFELPVLQAVAQRDASALMASLDEALQDELLIAAPDSKTAFAFAHELLRAVLYEGLPHAERRAYHLQVAHALVQRRQAADAVPAADIAFHFHAALPHPALEDTVRWCTKAARDAARVLANQDAVRYLDHALQALDLQRLEHRESPERRLTLLLWQALHARTYSPERFEHTIRDVIRIAREQRAGVQLAAAALMLDLHPGFPPLRGSRAALEDALQLLPADDGPTRAQLLARLATSAPLAYDAAASGQQLARAIELNQGQRTLLGDYTTRSARLYLHGGPADPVLREQALRELRELCATNPVLSVPPVLLELQLAIGALQAGELSAMSAALDRGEALCHALDHRELLWHLQRLRALAQVDAGQLSAGHAALRALHAGSGQGQLGTALFRAHDFALILGEAPDAELRGALAPEPDDPPNVWSMKVRALAALGRRDDALRALHAVAPARLCALPCDRDYLGTLGALARAALALQAAAYFEPLYASLAPYPRCFAAHVAFVCEGSVAHLLGLLASALGRRALALEQLELGLAESERAGLLLCSLQARLDLARCLTTGGSASERQRGEQLERAAHEQTRELRLQTLVPRI